ncbi:MAG: type I glyceraldehyde-3-phosphate dehydrogenase, partial [Mycobacterium sp.]|nr:type I glyceraldehyde-3-phosphate dehydrogenase [Mycobacterium sp.]
QGKLNGFAVRVPTKDVSMVDLVVQVKKSTDSAAVNAALKAAANGPMKGVLAVSEEPLVSCDYIGNPASSTVDLEFIEVMQGNMIKAVSWYDNEWGYSSRCIDLMRYMAGRS